MSIKQKALFLEKKYGDFVLGEKDIPTPGRNDVLVKINGASLNFRDLIIPKVRSVVPCP